MIEGVSSLMVAVLCHGFAFTSITSVGGFCVYVLQLQGVLRLSVAMTLR